jgi:hypothetical protein
MSGTCWIPSDWSLPGTQVDACRRNGGGVRYDPDRTNSTETLWANWLARIFGSRRALTCVKRTSLIAGLFVVTATFVTAQDGGKGHPPQNFTLSPPSIYMQFFQACSSDKPCTRTEDFRVDPVPKGCCILTVTNGNGQGKDEVRSFEVFLNGKSVVSSDHSPNAQSAVAVQTNNKIKLILTGEPSSKLFVLIAYDPSHSE